MAQPSTPIRDGKPSTPSPITPAINNNGPQNSGGRPTAWYHQSNDNNNRSSSANGGNQSNLSDRSQGASSTSKGQSTPGENFDPYDMVDKTIQFGKDSCIIKAYIPCENKQLFALECERSISGYDGICPVCNREHLKLAKNRGFYVSIDSVYKTLGQQQLEKERLQGRKPIEKLIKIKDKLPPLNHEITGINKGIQGDSNSCYMDSTIFCMFAYSGVFDLLLHMDVAKNEPLLNLQKLLRQNIVNVLRSESGFVERDALFHLREQLSKATGDQSFIEMEKDPSEFLRALEVLFHYAPLKTIPPDQLPKEDQSNITTNIIWEMFDANPQNLPSTNIASIFRNSLTEIPAKLATIPPFLVLVAPRHARSQRSYRYIIPDRQITLDNKMVQLVCLHCKQTNHDPTQSRDFYFCNDCYSKESSSISTLPTDTTVACYCFGCLEKLHKNLTKQELLHEHSKPKQLKTIAKLNLFAVLCIETSHYVAFVKCHKADQQHEWIFFDSMSDRIHNEKNVPCVSRVPDFDRWIEKAEQDKYFFEDLDSRRKQGRPTSQTFSESEMRLLRLFRDGAFFFYENSAVNYQ